MTVKTYSDKDLSQEYISLHKIFSLNNSLDMTTQDQFIENVKLEGLPSKFLTHILAVDSEV